MQLTLADTNVKLETIPPNHDPYMGITVFSSKEATCYSGNQNVPEKLMSDIFNDEKCHLQILCLFKKMKPSKYLWIKCTTPANDILKRIWERFHDKVEISLFVTASCDDNHPLFSIQGMTIDTQYLTSQAMGKFGVYVNQDIEKFCNSDCNVKIIACVPCETSEISYLEPSKRPTTSQMILETGVANDVIIIAENGAEIRAHKNFLFVWSTTLEAMFLSGMEESQTGRLDMSDMSEQGVWSFLRYLYYDDLEGPKRDVGIAYELLYAAHKYEVTELEKLMLKRLLEAPNKDFKAKVAFRIYCFVRNIESAAELKLKMVGILQMKIDEVKTLPEYRKLFQKNPDDAMELCEYFAKAALK